MEQVKSSFQKSLTNLQTTYLDSYILHTPLNTLELTLEAWRVLIALQDEGKIRKIGLSNVYDVGLLRALDAEKRVQVVQNRWHERNNWDRDVCGYCRENEIEYQFVGCSPFRGMHQWLISWHRSFWTLSGSPRLLSHPDLLLIAKHTECTVQLAGITPLSGTTNEQHMKDDVAVEDITFGEDLDSQLRCIRRLVGIL